MLLSDTSEAHGNIATIVAPPFGSGTNFRLTCVPTKRTIDLAYKLIGMPRKLYPNWKYFFVVSVWEHGIPQNNFKSQRGHRSHLVLPFKLVDETLNLHIIISNQTAATYPSVIGLKQVAYFKWAMQTQTYATELYYSPPTLHQTRGYIHQIRTDTLAPSLQDRPLYT